MNEFFYRENELYAFSIEYWIEGVSIETDRWEGPAPGNDKTLRAKMMTRAKCSQDPEAWTVGLIDGEVFCISYPRFNDRKAVDEILGNTELIHWR